MSMEKKIRQLIETSSWRWPRTTLAAVQFWVKNLIWINSCKYQGSNESLIWCNFLDSDIRNTVQLFHEQASVLSCLHHQSKWQKPADYFPSACGERAHVCMWVGWVRMCIHVCVHVCACRCNDWRSTLSVILQNWDMELTDELSLSDQWVHGHNHLCPPQHCDYKYKPPCPVSYVGAWDQTWVLTPGQ